MFARLMETSMYDAFAREIYSGDLLKAEVSKILPGILSTKTLFNQNAVKKVFSENPLWLSKDIIVYFNHFHSPNIDSTKKDGKWYDALQEFVPLVKDFPAGVKLEYWYGDAPNEHSSSRLDISKKPYQAFVRLFNDSIQGFSCFVNNNPSELRFSSTRTNYETIKSGEGLIHDNQSSWKGNAQIFENSAYRLSSALEEMERKGYIVTGIPENLISEDADVRIIVPGRGALVSCLRDDLNVTLFLKESAIEKMVNERK